MKIVLGSTSQSKVEILKNVLKNDQIDAEIIPIEVDSGIADQPLDEKTTIQGAVNRATNAISNFNEELDLSIGLEGGLVFINDIYYLVCAASIIDKDGNKYIGISKKIPLPKIVSGKVKEGEQFGIVIREFEATLEESESQELKDLVKELISREQSFTEAIKIALAKKSF